jgi:hypothetical protein
MAVKIDIPGIGEVIAENAASEETLRKLVAAVEQAGKSSGSTAKVQQEQAKAVNDTTKALKNMTQGSKDFSVGWAAAGDAAVKSLKNLGVTATAVAAKFLTQYADIADNPIKAGRDLINTGIDIVADFAGGLSKAIPFIGEFVSGLSKAAAEIAKAANVVFADQLEKNVKALQDYAKSGVSFLGGMAEMQMAATSAGLGIKDFSTIVSKSKAELNKLGLAGGESADRLSRSLGLLAAKRPGGFPSIRDELLKLGYTYEDQGVILAGFMANMQASGRLRSMSDKEIAEGTRQYAKDLKVITDLTGQDAQKLMERSRAESMRGALLTKLTDTQRDSFMKANSVFAKAGPEVQAALTQYLTFGTITDPKIAANQAMVDMVQSVGAQIQSGNTDMINVTQQEMSRAYKTLTTSSDKFAETTDMALVAGTGSLAGSVADVTNRFLSSMGGLPDPDAAKKSADAAESMMTSLDPLSVSFAKLTDDAKDFQVLLETKVNKNLDDYSKLLAQVNEQTMKMVGNLAGLFAGKPTEQQKKSSAYIFGGGINENAFSASKGIPTFAEGGKLGAGKVGIAGERGPELISGPATILSNASYEQLMVALDAMREQKGVRFKENGFEWNVNMGRDPGYISGGVKSRAELLNKRTSGFESLKPNDLLAEMQKRPEYADMQRAKDKMMEEMGDDPKTAAKEHAAKIDQTNSLLSELVSAMKQNVSQTARVAMNTN